MPDSPTPVWRKVLESTLTAMILASLQFVVSVVVTVYASYSAYLSGRPFYEVAPYVAGLLCVCVVILFVSWRWFERVQRYLSEHRLKWLVDIAEADRTQIDRAVRLTACNLTRIATQAETSYVTAVFSVFNGSLYPITFARQLDGFVKLGTTPLKGGRIVMVPEYLVMAIESRQSGAFEIMLWLDESEMKMIEGSRERHESVVLHFDQLLVTTIGARESDNVVPRNLKLINVSAFYP
jgi:hypothetical protein